MRHRRYELVGSLLAVLTVAGLAVTWWWTMARPYPCRATFEKVKVGMTREEVEATVGGPPRSRQELDFSDISIWEAGDGTGDAMSVFFDPHTNAVCNVLVELGGSPSFLDRLRARLGI